MSMNLDFLEHKDLHLNRLVCLSTEQNFTSLNERCQIFRKILINFQGITAPLLHGQHSSTNSILLNFRNIPKLQILLNVGRISQLLLYFSSEDLEVFMIEWELRSLVSIFFFYHGSFMDLNRIY